VTAQLHQLSTVLELVRLGLGLSFIPQMATTAFAHPDLVFRSLSGDQPSRTLAVAWSKLRLRHLAMQPFLATLGCPAPPP
jgi:LysR family hydrogen peroxide-inducible transcriptional activator